MDVRFLSVSIHHPSASIIRHYPSSVSIHQKSVSAITSVSDDYRYGADGCFCIRQHCFVSKCKIYCVLDKKMTE